ncbi:protein FAM131A isoform X2 [Anguilla rostrata]|uniref:protein FAM131A isoform X2 n=1 Tax=Anguilla rostrata TaxID=7938 RepID=UPI0030CD24AA
MEIRFTTFAREGSESKQRRVMFEKKNSFYAVSFAENHSFSDRAMGVVTEDGTMVNVDETIDMLPKSRKALTIQEIAALARSSLYGISQVVKDHVTKPTAMAQGRVAHLIEWKGWCRPCDSPAALESHFSSYSHLTEGEQEARFAAGVAEQFAIAEAKLRAWSSVDGEDSYEDSCDEDAAPYSDANLTTQSGDSSLYPQFIQDLWQGQVFQPEVPRPAEDSPAPPGAPADTPDTFCSRVSCLEDGPVPESARNPPPSPSHAGCPRGGQEPLEEEEAKTGDSTPCCPSRGMSQDSAYTPSSCLSYLDAEDELESTDRDVLLGNTTCRKVLDEPSSGAMSLEEEEEEDEDERREEGHQ